MKIDEYRVELAAIQAAQLAILNALPGEHKQSPLMREAVSRLQQSAECLSGELEDMLNSITAETRQQYSNGLISLGEFINALQWDTIRNLEFNMRTSKPTDQ